LCVRGARADAEWPGEWTVSLEKIGKRLRVYATAAATAKLLPTGLF
jgi:hypothetical protein